MPRGESIVVLRPGALGDVLVARGVLRFLRLAFPRAAITLLAPGERGVLFKQAGWIDRLFDWDRAEYAGLFAENGGENARTDARLRETFAGCGLLIAFVDRAADPGSAFQKNIAELTPDARRLFAPPRPRPEDNGRIPMGEWLLGCVRGFCLENDLLPASGHLPDAGECLAARIAVPARARGNALVVHPGSGSRTKNWPVANYAALAHMLLDVRDPCGPDGGRLFSRLVITAGEADGELGEELRSLVPGAELHPQGGLADLAGLLAGARLYVGNDSGVSHLASAVRREGGCAPQSAVVFGPSDARVWAPPGALIVDAGVGMDDLPPEAFFSRIMRLFRGGQSLQSVWRK